MMIHKLMSIIIRILRASYCENKIVNK